MIVYILGKITLLAWGPLFAYLDFPTRFRCPSAEKSSSFFLLNASRSRVSFCASFSFGWCGGCIASLMVVKFSFCYCYSFFQELFVLRNLLSYLWSLSSPITIARLVDETLLQVSYFGTKTWLLFGTGGSDVVIGLWLWQSCVLLFDGSWISTSALFSVIGVGVYPSGRCLDCRFYTVFLLFSPFCVCAAWSDEFPVGGELRRPGPYTFIWFHCGDRPYCEWLTNAPW